MKTSIRRTAWPGCLVGFLLALPVPGLGAPAQPAARTIALEPIVPLGVPASPNISIRPSPSASRSRGDVRAIYRSAAPATVIVRTVHGHGSGVVITKTGRVLTNHHVAVDGAREGLKVKVDVEIGTLSPDGVMVRSGKPLSAHVLKWDRKLDMAVLQIDKPPAGLRWVEVAKRPVTPGEPVTVLGHGGIGLLWAIRDCEVEGVGYLYDALANDVIAPLGARDAAPALQARRQRRSPGRVIQTSCAIAPGDSGGPVVNRKGELVGLNDFLLKDESVPVASSFHVEGREIQAFLRDVPREPPPLFPDPWDAGEKGSLDDLDRNGSFDILRLSSPEAKAVFFDLTGGKAKPGPKPTVDQVIDGRAFRAQLVFYQDRSGVYAWYDTRGEGAFDRLLVADDDGAVRAGFALRKGSATPLEASTLPRAVVAPELFQSPAQRTFIEGVAARALPGSWARLAGGGNVTVPSAWVTDPDKVQVLDVDEDGRYETVLWNGEGATGVVVALEKQAPAGATEQEAAKAIRADANLALRLEPGEAIWVFYPSGGGTGLPLALRSAAGARGAVTEAYVTNTDKTPARREGEAGRLVVRPGLLNLSKAGAERLAKLVAAIGMEAMTAKGEAGLGSLPSIHGAGWEGPERLDQPGLAAGIVGFSAMGAESIVVDLRNRWKEMTDEAIEAAAAAGSLPASFAFLQGESFEWTFYDRDGDGRLDLVLFSADPSKGRATAAYVVTGDGVLKESSELAGGPLFRASVFQDAAQAEGAGSVFDAIGVPTGARELRK
jgi:hypothetical protein